MGSVELETWYEGEQGWKKLDALSSVVDLARLRRVQNDGKLPNNTLQFTLSSAPQALFCLPHLNPEASGHQEGKPSKSRDSVRGVVERSLRETRMKQGVGVGGLHQYVDPFAASSWLMQAGM